MSESGDVESICGGEPDPTELPIDWGEFAWERDRKLALAEGANFRFRIFAPPPIETTQPGVMVFEQEFTGEDRFDVSDEVIMLEVPVNWIKSNIPEGLDEANGFSKSWSKGGTYFPGSYIAEMEIYVVKVNGKYEILAIHPSDLDRKIYRYSGDFNKENGRKRVANGSNMRELLAITTRRVQALNSKHKKDHFVGLVIRPKTDISGETQFDHDEEAYGIWEEVVDLNKVSILEQTIMNANPSFLSC